MIKRYRHAGGLILAPTEFASNTKTAETASTATYDSVITGEPGSVVTLEVTVLTHTAPGYQFEVDSNTYLAGDTFTKTIGGGGSVTITQLLDVGTLTSGNLIAANLLITHTTIGKVDPIANLTSNSKNT